MITERLWCSYFHCSHCNLRWCL